MTDPRKETWWKQTRHDKRLELLLGAILDALPAKEAEPPPVQVRITNTRKSADKPKAE